MDKEQKDKRTTSVIDDYSGIIYYGEAFYIETLKYSAKKCIETYLLYNNSLTTKSDPELIASLIQEALSHAAALSRFFWPGTKNKLSVARGKKLRDAFNTPDSSPLKNRNLRNAIEHFDEKLDDYLLNDLAGVILPRAMVGNHTMGDEKIAHIFKLIDTENLICVILGVKYHFGEIFIEVQRILNLANIMADNGLRLRS